MIIIAIISALISGMGIGGGAIYVLLTTIFLKYDQKEAQALNLLMFIAVGVSVTVANFKNKNIELKIFKKVIPLLTLGCFIGSHIMTKVESKNLKKYFSLFLVIIGIYEIITSLIRIKKAKNNTS